MVQHLVMRSRPARLVAALMNLLLEMDWKALSEEAPSYGLMEPTCFLTLLSC
jgi:hypothetical protein